MLDDVRFALRRLAHAPLFTAFAVVTLALAIGITTAVYSLVRAGLQPELGLNNADGLLLVTTESGPLRSANQVSWLDYHDLMSQATVLDDKAAWAGFRNALVARGTSQFTGGEAVTGNYFKTIELRAMRGRLIDADDDQPGATPVAVLSAEVWREHFGGDPSAIGETLKIGGQLFQIVGIAPASFRGLAWSRSFARPGIWISLSAFDSVRTRFDRRDPQRRDHRWLSVFGRLNPSHQRAAAAAELRAIGERIDAVAPLPDHVFMGGATAKQPRSWTAVGPADRVDLSDAKDVFRVVLMLPILVLLVACTNVANFALSRGVARQNGFAVCRALGASRWQLLRGQLIEYGVVAGAGALGAVVVATGLLTMVATAVRSATGGSSDFRVDTTINGDILEAVGIAALLSFLVAGLLPAMQLTGRSLRHGLAVDQGAASLPRWRGRSNLIALQLSVSVALLLVAALCVRQLPKLHEQSPSGMALDQVALVRVPFDSQSIGEQRARVTLDQLLARLKDLPAVVKSAVASERDASGYFKVAPEGRALFDDARSPSTRLISVSPTYFETVGLPFVAGRPFGDRDTAGSERVAIINAAQARTLFGTIDVVGKRLTIQSVVSGAPTTWTLVGVSNDTRSERGHVEEAVLVPIAQRFVEYGPVEVLARAREGVDPAGLATQARDALRRIDPDIAVGFVGSADATNFGPRVAMRYFIMVFGSLAFLALAFAMSGLYGVLSHVVARRTRELGVRAALGASPARLIRLVLRDGSRPVIEGIVIGFGMAAGARLGMQPWFTEPVTAVDPVALVIALIPLLAAATLACYIPARRASRVDPNVALREL